MAAKAAEEALADSGLKAEEIDLILVATSSSETVFPNTSFCRLQVCAESVLSQSGEPSRSRRGRPRDDAVRRRCLQYR